MEFQFQGDSCVDTLDKLTMGPPDLIPHRSVTAQQPAFLPNKPQPVCVCLTGETEKGCTGL